MSFAVHKNADAGQLQREIQQKPQIDQMALAEVQQRATEGSRKRAEGLKETDKSEIRNGGEEKKRKQNAASRTANGASDSPGQPPTQAEHPYKGHHVDVSL
jgi:hypothetical protein